MLDAGQAGLFQALAHSAARAVELNPQRIIGQTEIICDDRTVHADQVGPPDQIGIIRIERRQHLVEASANDKIDFFIIEQERSFGSIGSERLARARSRPEMIGDRRVKNLG